MEIRHVLSPVDFSGLSAHALRYASMLAHQEKARLTAVYAESFSPPPYFTEGQIENLERQFRDAFRGAEAALRRFVEEQLGPDAARVTETRVIEAPPADGIRRVAEETRVDLIVMGTHGRSGMNRLMLGSVAERVLRESEIPVLTVRGDTGAEISPPRDILCPVDDTPAGREALATAASVASRAGGSVIALHVTGGHAGRGIGDLCAWVPDDLRRHCAIREVTRQGDPAEQIVSLAREMPCDLLVIGARRQRFFESAVLGSTTARVVRHAPCAVLTVKGRPTQGAPDSN